MNLPLELVHATSLVDDHPDSVCRLRRLVVALAITGKLTKERNRTEASKELLRQIDARHRQLVMDGKLKRAPSLLAIAEANLPEVCPPGPLYLRLGDVAQIEKGRTGIASAQPGPYPLVVTAQERAKCDHFDFEAAAAIVPLVSSAGHGKASLQRLHYQEGKFALGTILAAVIPRAPDLLSARFIFEYLTTFKAELLVSQMIGTANVTLTIGKVASTPIPLVPRTVQKRVDELMALCDRLEAARAEREAARDRLTTASLALLSTPDPDTFSEDTRFALGALPALTARIDQIKRLRQTILHLAVRGKLVPQDPSDAPPPIREADQAANSTSRLEVELPANWRWARLSDVAVARLGKMLDRAKNTGRQYPYLRNTNVHWFEVRVDDIKTISLEDREFGEYRLVDGDILICEGGHGIGRTAVWRGADANMVFQKALHRVRAGENLDPDFFSQCCFVYFDAGIMQSYFTGVGIPHFTGKALSQLVFPLPPIAEQRRIVAKVRELISLCDQLESSLANAAEHQRRLLDVLLHETLDTCDPEHEAA